MTKKLECKEERRRFEWEKRIEKRAMNSFKKHKENMEKLNEEIIELLKNSPDRFILGDVIVETIGLRDKVQLRQSINDIRREGIPIIASNKGYKYTEDVEEIIIYANSLLARSNDMMEAYKGVLLFIAGRNNE